MRAQGTLPGVRLAHQAVSGKQPLCQLWRHTSSCRRAIRTIFLIVLNYATRRGVIEHPIQRVRSKRSTRERLPRPCYHERGFPITGFTMESYTLSPSLLRTRRTFTGTDLHSFIMSQYVPPPPFCFRELSINCTNMMTEPVLEPQNGAARFRILWPLPPYAAPAYHSQNE